MTLLGERRQGHRSLNGRKEAKWEHMPTIMQEDSKIVCAKCEETSMKRRGKCRELYVAADRAGTNHQRKVQHRHAEWAKQWSRKAVDPNVKEEKRLIEQFGKELEEFFGRTTENDKLHTSYRDEENMEKREHAKTKGK